MQDENQTLRFNAAVCDALVVQHRFIDFRAETMLHFRFGR